MEIFLYDTLKFSEGGQLFVGMHNKALSVAAMSVSKRSRPWPTISNVDS
jgi:hypothetical protein